MQTLPLRKIKRNKTTKQNQMINHTPLDLYGFKEAIQHTEDFKKIENKENFHLKKFLLRDLSK